MSVASAGPLIAPTSPFEELDELRQLDTDWDGYGAPAPNTWALETASRAIRSFLDLKPEPTKVAPLGRGGVEIYFSRGEKIADLQCWNSERMFVATSDSHGNIEVQEIGSVKLAIEKIQGFIER